MANAVLLAHPNEVTILDIIRKIVDMINSKKFSWQVCFGPGDLFLRD